MSEYICSKCGSAGGETTSSRGGLFPLIWVSCEACFGSGYKPRYKGLLKPGTNEIEWRPVRPKLTK